MILELRNICKTYLQGRMEVPVLKNVSLSVEEGEYVAIMGPSGSGKTTLMNLIGCLDSPTSGEYFLEGEDLSQQTDTKLSEVRLKSIGFVFQSFYLLSRQSAVENVALPLLYAGVKRKERMETARKALERVGLGDRLEFKPTQLSGGQCQRVAIARAIVNNPKILLADEPTGALDTASGEQIMEIFQKLSGEGVTILMITHEPEIAAHAQRVLHIRDGRLVDAQGNFLCPAEPPSEPTSQETLPQAQPQTGSAPSHTVIPVEVDLAASTAFLTPKEPVPVRRQPDLDFSPPAPPAPAEPSSPADVAQDVRPVEEPLPASEPENTTLEESLMEPEQAIEQEPEAPDFKSETAFDEEISALLDREISAALEPAVSPSEIEPETEQETSVPEIELEMEQETSVPEIDLETEQETSVPEIDLETEQETSVPEIELEIEQEISVPEIELETEQETSVPEIELEIEQEISVPEIELETEQETSVPEIELEIEQEISVPEIELETEQETSVTQAANEPELVARPTKEGAPDQLSFDIWNTPETEEQPELDIGAIPVEEFETAEEPPREAETFPEEVESPEPENDPPAVEEEEFVPFDTAFDAVDPYEPQEEPPQGAFGAPLKLDVDLAQVLNAKPRENGDFRRPIKVELDGLGLEGGGTSARKEDDQ